MTLHYPGKAGVPRAALHDDRLSAKEVSILAALDEVLGSPGDYAGREEEAVKALAKVGSGELLEGMEALAACGYADCARLPGAGLLPGGVPLDSEGWRPAADEVLRQYGELPEDARAGITCAAVRWGFGAVFGTGRAEG